ncbi:MAG TPA: alpha/beta fold hydrolase [Solirubrobacteraceae bacterium]|nr:alpha/beta fold hydrolase [Solirubrobacteraceae bacterium]
MTDAELRTAAGLAYREALPRGTPTGTLLCVHGYPESSYMWCSVLAAAAAAGWRALAPDLPGYGDSPLAGGDGSWERHLAALGAFHAALALGPVALAVHDWGGLIGLRWACENPAAIRALSISDTGFFADGKWHGLAQAMRTPGQGEELAAGMTADGFAAMLGGVSRMTPEAIAEYWKGYDGEERRRAHLELYRSGDFDKLEPYAGRLAALSVPTLLLWGADDPFAPLAGAHRLLAEIPGARLEVVAGSGHFVFDDAPDEAARLLVEFLRGL